MQFVFAGDRSLAASRFFYSVKMLVSPTNDMGKLLAALSESTLGGEADIGAGVQVAKVWDIINAM